MKRSCIVIDSWKLPVFERVLSREGFVLQIEPGAFPDTTHIVIETDEKELLQKCINACDLRCAEMKN